MDAHTEANKIMFAALERGERERERIQTEPVEDSGHCWNCEKLGLCSPATDDDTCDNWEGF